MVCDDKSICCVKKSTCCVNKSTWCVNKSTCYVNKSICGNNKSIVDNSFTGNDILKALLVIMAQLRAIGVLNCLSYVCNH